MYLGLISFPLLGSVVSGFFGRKVGVNGAQLITCLSVIITTVLAILCFLEVGINSVPVTINLFRWMDIELFNILCGFEYDSLTVSMLIPVLIISSLVHIYSISYMSSDPHIPRFFSYLSLFTFMMVILVTANNYLLMFVGWEGVGVCSYLLVSFWFTRIAANLSSISAFLTNRVGDCFLTIGMLVVLWSLGNVDYATVFSLAPYVNSNIIIIIGICLLIGAMAKSSQVGLHVWLPMAMEGPTPVSALIHAATMVTAGVYLLMRSSPIIEYSNTVLLLCLWLGAITTVFSSLIGLFQQDIKKIIAYSTMSQLGMMVIGIGLSSYNLALFHLINHAFYKALLFLGAGSVIHAVADNQDLRKYGGLINYLPLTYSVMLIASLSLVAFPFMTGFYSKDFILESAYGQFSFSGVAIYIIATIGAIFTTLYSVKVLYLTFLANPNGSRTYYRVVIDNLFINIKSYKPAHEGDFFLTSPLIILALFSIFFGFITKDIFIGLGSNFFVDNSLFIHPTHEIMIDTEFAVPVLFKLLPFVFTISFSIIALILSELLSELIIYFKLSRLGYNIFGFFNQRFLIEYFYNKYITNLILNLGGQITKILDKGSIELFGPFGLEKGLVKLSKNISYLNTSHVTTYALFILIGFILYLTYYILEFNILLLGLLLLLWLGSGDYKESEEVVLYSTPYNYNNNLKNNSITYIYNNKRMFSTSGVLLTNGASRSNNSGSNPQDSSNNNNNNDNNNNDNSGVIPETHPEAVAKRQEVLDAMANRDEIGRRYIDVNNEHSEFQDNDMDDPMEEAELASTLDYVANELRRADDKVAELHSEYKNKTGKDIPGASEWPSIYPLERGEQAYRHFEEGADVSNTNSTTAGPSNTINPADPGPSNTTNPTDPGPSNTTNPTYSDQSTADNNASSEESLDERENSNDGTKRSRSDSLEEQESLSKRQRLDSDNDADDEGSDDEGGDGPLSGNDGTEGSSSGTGGGNSYGANKQLIEICLWDEDYIEGDELEDLDGLDGFELDNIEDIFNNMPSIYTNIDLIELLKDSFNLFL